MMARLFKRLENVLAYIAAAFVCIIMVFTTADIFARTLFNRPIPGLYEIIEGYLLVGAAFFGMLYSYRRGALVRITVLVDHFPKPAKLAIEYFVLGFSFLTTVLFVTATFRTFLRSLASGAALIEWNLPEWPSYLLIPITLAFLALAMAMDITRIKSGTADMLREEKLPGSEEPGVGGW
jgi:C4-dicarboxylate transporter, DctQ subunit